MGLSRSAWHQSRPVGTHPEAPDLEIPPQDSAAQERRVLPLLDNASGGLMLMKLPVMLAIGAVAMCAAWSPRPLSPSSTQSYCRHSSFEPTLVGMAKDIATATDTAAANQRTELGIPLVHDSTVFAVT